MDFRLTDDLFSVLVRENFDALKATRKNKELMKVNGVTYRRFDNKVRDQLLENDWFTECLIEEGDNSNEVKAFQLILTTNRPELCEFDECSISFTVIKFSVSKDYHILFAEALRTGCSAASWLRFVPFFFQSNWISDHLAKQNYKATSKIL